MSKVLLIGITAFLALICPGLSCSSGSGKSCYSLICRNRRAAEDATQVEELLLSFDSKLTEELGNEINAMSPSDRQAFLQDLRKMNLAAEAEYKSLKGAQSSLSQEELVKTVTKKIGQDFSGKRWFKRLRSLAGDKINYLVNNASDI